MDEAAIEPISGPVDADVTVPGSKSFTNRALVCAALAEGRSTLRGALPADDTEAMVGALGALGIAIETDWAAATVAVEGRGGTIGDGERTIDARMSGTTARFVAPILALGQGRYTLTGHAQLLARPMATVVELLGALGAEVRELGEPGHLPLRVGGAGRLPGGVLPVPGSVSSQFLSGLLLAAPLADQPTVVEVTGDLVSRPYVDLTRSVMAAFGGSASGVDETGRFLVAPTGYRHADVEVEPDASAASYFFAAAAVCGGRVRVEGLGTGTVQGDLRFVDVLEDMGCEVEVADGYTEVGNDGTLDGVDVDLADLSDTAPTLAVVAAFARTPTRVRGIGFIRRKETDRIAAVVTELRRCGVDAVEEADGFLVRPSADGPRPARIETYDDHRMAMSFSILGLKVPGTVIADPGCVAKTFPTFFEALDALR